MNTLDWAFVERILKFGVVGSLCFVIDFGTTYVCKERLRLNKFIANAIGFIISVMVNYTLNKYWTFQATNSATGVEFLKFIAITSFALIINSIIIYLLNVKIKMNFYLCKLVAVFVVMFFNYSMHSLYTFAQNTSQ